MLSSLVKEHSQRQAVRREHQETLRQNANKASADLTQALVDHLVRISLFVLKFHTKKYTKHNIMHINLCLIIFVECRSCSSLS